MGSRCRQRRGRLLREVLWVSGGFLCGDCRVGVGESGRGRGLTDYCQDGGEVVGGTVQKEDCDGLCCERRERLGES